MATQTAPEATAEIQEVAAPPAEEAADEILSGPPVVELGIGSGKVSVKHGNDILAVVTGKGYSDNGKSIATATNGKLFATVAEARKVANKWKRDLAAVMPSGKRVGVAFPENENGEFSFALYLANKGTPRPKKK